MAINIKITPKKEREDEVSYGLNPIKEYENKKNIGFVIFDNKTIDEIYKKSGKDAIGNEFQISYWSIIFRIEFIDSTIIDIQMPTALFNYPQKVTGAHIDFHLSDVDKIGKKIKQVHEQIANQINEKGIIDELKKIENVKSVTVLEEYTSNIHRHP
jgi:hypothetical protein